MKHSIIISFVVFFSDKEWGLPLAIAANLHLPYRIKIGLDGLIENHNVDAFDRRKLMKMILIILYTNFREKNPNLFNLIFFFPQF